MAAKTTQIHSVRIPGSITLTTFFFLGSFSIITQSTLLRELLVVALGNEVIFGTSLTCWLTGVFAGAFAGGHVSDRTKKTVEFFTLSIVILCILSPVAITFIRILFSLSGTDVGAYINFFKVFLFSALIIIPFSFFIGFIFPFAAKLNLMDKNTKNKTSATHIISQVYIYESAGSLFAGMLFSFILAGKFNHYFCIALSSIMLLAGTAVMNRKTKHNFFLLLLSVLIALNLFFLTPAGSNKFDSLMIKKRWNSFSGLPLVYSVDSRYQNIAIGKNEESFNLFTNGQFSTTFPEDNDNMILASHIVTQHKDPKKILIMGEAISGLAKHLLKFDLEEVISVEIDPVLTDTIRRHLPDTHRDIFSDRRFIIKNQDGRRYVKSMLKKSTKGDFDVVFLNMPEPSSLFLNRYYTLEFFRDLSGILSEGGVFALQITSSENYVQGIVSDYTVSIYNTLKMVFPHVVVAPGVTNFFFVSSSPDNITDSPEVLASRYREKGIKPEKLGLIFQSIYPEEKTRFIKKALNKSENKNINTDNKPLSTFYFNRILGWYSGSNLEKFFNVFEKISLKTIGLIMIILILFRLLFVKFFRTSEKSGQRFNILFSVIVGGFAGISLELLVIFSFQNIFGYVYQLIGFIIALFMLGLPLGAYISTRMMRKGDTKRKKGLIYLFSIQVIIATISLAFPLFIRIFAGVTSIKIFIFMFTVIVGMLVGSIFPAALNLYLNEREAGKSAGIVDAFDHLGAALGAMFTGAILLPILGIAECSYLLFILALFSALLLLVNIFHPEEKKV